MSKKHYYNILGLEDEATHHEVRKAYRKLVMLYHPDKNDSVNAKAKFIIITEAYEILIDKRPIPAHQQRVRRSTSRRPQATSTAEQQRQQQEQRAKEAKQRFKEKVYKEHIENERYYQKLTTGVRWRIMKTLAYVGLIVSVLLISDYMLPHHLKQDQITHFSRGNSKGLDGNHISLIQTASGESFWIERITYNLYGKYHAIEIEESWVFHNPIRIISRGKLENRAYTINFNVHRLSWLLSIVFLVPLLTILYKRRNLNFTLLYHFSFYAVGTLMLLFLLTGHRWAHVLTLGFL